MKKRKWVYCQKPNEYGIRCDICNGNKVEWSEFIRKIWCYDCRKDTRGTAGIFGAPIPVEIAALLGMSFDRIEIETGRLMKMIVGKRGVEWK